MKIKNKKISKILGLEEDDFFKFYKKTLIANYPKSKIKNIPSSWVQIHYKTYNRFKSIPLKTDSNILNKKITKIFLARKSSRESTENPLSFDEICTLLLLSTGLVKYVSNLKETARRFYPSAGARYPLEIYIYANNCETLKKGIYHYNVKDNSLEIIQTGNFSSALHKITGETWPSKSALVIFISSNFKRTTVKYGLRGYRFPFIEAGHVAQNIYLVCSALNLKCCSLGGFIDDETNKLLDLDYQKESIILMLAINK